MAPVPSSEETHQLPLILSLRTWVQSQQAHGSGAGGSDTDPGVSEQQLAADVGVEAWT